MGNVWISKARRTGFTHEFFEKGYITLGWPKLPNLSNLTTKEELTKIYDPIYSSEKLMQRSIRVGQIWKFFHEVKIGDIIIFPEKEPLKQIWALVEEIDNE